MYCFEKEITRVNRARPVYLNLLKIRQPIPAIVSILHRISGFILFLMIPFLLWLLAYSLTDSGFSQLHQLLSNPYLKLFLWLFLIPICFHLVAGIRHLLSDIHLGDTLPAGRVTAWVTFLISFLLIALVGIWLW